jgi:two-component system OmpR family sensor kinase
VTVLGHEGRLRQVVTNLVANALRHTPAGSPVEVAVGTQPGPDGGSALVEVRDHGPGVEASQIRRVFERFYRSDSSRGRVGGGGSGLGLAIVAAIVSSHGGRVGIASTPGGGATFVVSLPLTQVRDTTPDDAGADDRGTDPAVDDHGFTADSQR